jgi:4-amino-4-deoxy-L-arabinose transferase-like glycosyltransferase
MTKRQLVIGCFVISYLVLAIAFATTIPVYEAPDEPGHFDLVAHMINHRSLPVQDVEHRNYAHHPPLYYFLVALPNLLVDINDTTSMPRFKPDFVWPGEDSPAVAFHYTAETFPYTGRVLGIHLARLISVLCGLLTLLLTVAIGSLLFPDRPEVSYLAAALVIFNPQFLFVNSTVNNDSLLIAACAGVIWQLLRTLQQPQSYREWLFLGLWGAAALLTKTIAVVVIGLVIISLFVWSIKNRALLLFFRGGLVFTATIAILAGWWFIRNQILYGDPFGWQIYQQAWAVNLRTSPLTVNELPFLLNTQFESFWGVFGWANLKSPDWFYKGVATILLLGAIGWFFAAVKGQLKSLTSTQKTAFLIFIAYIVFQELFLLYQNSVHNPTLAQGRFLLPVTVPLMFVISFGIVSLIPRKLLTITLGLFSFLFALTGIYLLVGIIAPAYSVVPQPKLTLLMIPNRTDFTFGDTFILHGYAWDIYQADDVTQIDIHLTWQAANRPDFDYSVFIHVVNSDNNVIAQSDQAPGSNHSYLPTMWQPGDIITDVWTIEMAGIEWQQDLYLRIGVYNWSTGQRLYERSGNDFIPLSIDVNYE